MPSISVIMTCYNLEKYIKEAICSFFAQDYPGEMELIVVDDASTDNSVKIIEATFAEYAGCHKVKLVKHDRNRGVVGATDSGMRAAVYDWFVFADGDDIQKPNRCSLMAQRIAEHPGVKAVTMSFEQVNAERVHLYYGSYLAGFGYTDSLPDCVYMDTVEKRADSSVHAGKEKLCVYGGCMGIHRSLYDRWGDLLAGGEDLPRFYQDPILENRALLSVGFLGTKDISIEYRCHGANLFNNVRPCNGISDYMRNEVEASQKLTARLASYTMMCRDCRRALNDCTLTDWSPAQLQRTIEYYESHINGCLLRQKWWQWSWFHRLWYVISSSESLPPELKKWPIWRLLPLPVFALLKWYQVKRRRKQSYRH